MACFAAGAMATESRCFGEVPAAATTEPRRAALVRVPSLDDSDLAVSDAEARSALHIRKAVESTVHTNPRPS